MKKKVTLIVVGFIFLLGLGLVGLGLVGFMLFLNARSADSSYLNTDFRQEFLRLEQDRSPSGREKLNKLLKEYVKRTSIIPGRQQRFRGAVTNESGNIIKPVLVRYRLANYSGLIGPVRSQPQVELVCNDGYIDVDFAGYDFVTVEVDGGRYYQRELVFERERGMTSFEEYNISDVEVTLRRGELLPLKGDPDRLAVVLKEIHDLPEEEYAQGIPDWLPKNYPIVDYEGKLDLGTKIVGIDDGKCVRAPVEGLYGMYGKSKNSGGAQLYVKEGTPLGFWLTKKKFVWGVVGSANDLGFGSDPNEKYEWVLKIARPEGVPVASQTP